MNPTHWTAPPTQCLVPATHSPASVPHFAPPPGSPSSIAPLQLLSLPSHSSAIGCLLHAIAPATHCLTAPVHSPVWFAHIWPTSGSGPSSTRPSQSLSSSSHTSGPVAVHAPPSPPVPPSPPSPPPSVPASPVGSQPMQYSLTLHDSDAAPSAISTAPSARIRSPLTSWPPASAAAT